MRSNPAAAKISASYLSPVSSLLSRVFKLPRYSFPRTAVKENEYANKTEIFFQPREDQAKWYP